MKHYVTLDEQAVTEEVITQLNTCLEAKPKAKEIAEQYQNKCPPTGS
jgi:hypothetical protein